MKTTPTATAAQEALHAVEDKARALGDSVRNHAHTALHTTREAATDAVEKARVQLDKCAQSTGRYVTEQPGKSVALAVVAGAALALASAALLCRRGH